MTPHHSSSQFGMVLNGKHNEGFGVRPEPPGRATFFSSGWAATGAESEQQTDGSD
jgi:hypothetical protein